MQRILLFFAVPALIATSIATSSAATPFQVCQRQATKMMAEAMISGNLIKMKKAIDKQDECRGLATKGDEKAIQFQNEMNELIREGVSTGTFNMI